MSEIHGAIGSYVIDALDPVELEEFEAHLAVCPTCSREVVEFCETAAELSLLATVAAPPPALRGSVLSAISEVRVLPPILPPLAAAGPEASPRRAAARSESVVAAPGPETMSPATPVDELAVRRARRRTRVLSLAVAAALVIALSLGGWVVSLNQSRQQQVASVSAETELFAAPDAHIYPVTLKSGGQASFVVSKQLNKALFIGRDLPDVGSQTFQLWTKGSSTPYASAGLVAGGGDRKVWIDGPIASSVGLAISLEKHGGVSAPTNPQAGADI